MKRIAISHISVYALTLSLLSYYRSFFVRGDSSNIILVDTARDRVAESKYFTKSSWSNKQRKLYCATCLCDFLKDHNWPCKEYKFTAQDGASLGLLRLPRPGKEVTLLQHGILADGWCWFSSPDGPNLSLALRLYMRSQKDVWIANSRGTSYSLPRPVTDRKDNSGAEPSQGETTPPSSFWNFTWEEMGLFDIPAVLTFIRSVIDKEREAEGQRAEAKMGSASTVRTPFRPLHQQDPPSLVYIGHSQGTTQLLAGMVPPYQLHQSSPSLRDLLTHPDRSRRLFTLRLVALLSPVAAFHTTGPSIARLISRLGLSWDLSILGFRVFPASPEENVRVRKGCRTVCEYLGTAACLRFLQVVSDGSTRHDNGSHATMEWAMDWFPETTSVRNIKHYTQVYSSERFRAYDYGWLKNLWKYNSVHPPAFDISQWPQSVPVAIFHAEKDELVAQDEVETIVSSLPQNTVVFKKTYKEYGHATWLIGTNDTTEWLDDLENLIAHSLPLSLEHTQK